MPPPAPRPQMTPLEGSSNYIIWFSLALVTGYNSFSHIICIRLIIMQEFSQTGDDSKFASGWRCLSRACSWKVRHNSRSNLLKHSHVTHFELIEHRKSLHAVNIHTAGQHTLQNKETERRISFSSAVLNSPVPSEECAFMTQAHTNKQTSPSTGISTAGQDRTGRVNEMSIQFSR